MAQRYIDPTCNAGDSGCIPILLLLYSCHRDTSQELINVTMDSLPFYWRLTLQTEISSSWHVFHIVLYCWYTFRIFCYPSVGRG